MRLMILPSARSAAGEGDREAVEGATPDTGRDLAPSTLLRMVPLPREGRGRIS